MEERDKEFADFYRLEVERLYRLALLLTGDKERAADLAQETLYRVYRAWKRISDSHGAYARKTLFNLWRNSIRRRFLERTRGLGRGEAASDHGGDVDEALRIDAALTVLSSTQRVVVVLRFYEDLPLDEISRILDRPLGTVKSDLHRALKKLRPVLDDRVEERT